MITVFLVLFVGIAAYYGAVASGIPIAAETVALVAGLIVFFLRMKRAFGIASEVDHLEDNLSDKYDELYNVDKRRGSSKLHNTIVGEIDATNKDRDNLKRRKW